MAHQQTWNIECRKHGLMLSAEGEAEVSAIIEQHWRRFHRGATRPIEGRDWIRYPALMRCDTCAVVLELPVWMHTSTHGPLGDSMMDLDGRWLLCATCHNLFAEGKVTPWVTHWIKVTASLTTYPPGMVQGVIRHDVERRLGALLEHLDAGAPIYAWGSDS